MVYQLVAAMKDRGWGQWLNYDSPKSKYVMQAIAYAFSHKVCCRTTPVYDINMQVLEADGLVMLLTPGTFSV